MELTGYLHPGYARSLSEFGSPTELPRSGGWFLKRNIPGSDAFDGIGCYPLFSCQNWSALAADIEALGNKIVSFAAAPDPLGRYALADLQRIFPDRMVFFKNHYVADLTRPLHEIISTHHYKRAERALHEIEVEFYSEPLAYLDEFLGLFKSSIQRFRIRGIRAYSRTSLARQLALPGIFLSMARYRKEPISAGIWLIHDDVAYAHLGASIPKTYELGADYALYHEEIRFFTGKVTWLDWGGEAGVFTGGKTLSSFKKGWSTGIRPAYFCGRIFDLVTYDRLTRAKQASTSDYFPAYREGEFAQTDAPPLV